MNRIVYIVISGILIFILVSGCVSIPKPETKNDTILVVKVKTRNETDWDANLFYYKCCIERNGIETWITVRPNVKFVVMHGLEPGRYSFTQFIIMNSNRFPQKFDHPSEVELVPGKIVVFPYSFLIEITREDKLYYQRISCEEMTLKDKTDMYDILKKEANFDSWEYEFE
jgi:hypothetical protein